MNTVGAGMVTHALRRSANISEHHYEVDRESRAAQKDQKAKVIGLTGLSGSGKSTIANALEKKLFSLGMHAYVLDGDNMRLGLNKDLGFTREDRAENVRRVSEVAHNLYNAGLVVVVALVSPYAEDRNLKKTEILQRELLILWTFSESVDGFIVVDGLKSSVRRLTSAPFLAKKPKRSRTCRSCPPISGKYRGVTIRIFNPVRLISILKLPLPTHFCAV